MDTLIALRKKIVNDIKVTFPEKEWDYRIKAVKSVMATMSKKRLIALAEQRVPLPDK